MNNSGMFPRIPRYINQPNISVLVYIIVISSIIGTAAYTARNIIFRPWTSRTWVSATQINNEIYIFGGRSSNRVLHDDIIKINLENHTLKRIDKLQSKQFATEAVAHQNDIYLFGGYDNNYRDQITHYNVKEKTLDTIGRFPHALAWGKALDMGKFIYYVSGWNGNTYSDQIFKIDPRNGEVDIAAILEESREFFSIAKIGKRIFMIGGENITGQMLDKISEIDIPSGAVNTIAKLPTARMYTNAVSVGNSIFVFGGRDTKKLNEIIKIDLNHNPPLVNQVAQLPFPIQNPAVVIIDEKIYIIGGEDEKTGRQLAVNVFSPKDYTVKVVELKSYSWW